MKKGFTLIELLAVIVILSIIMVIAVPRILDVIEKVDMESYRESVELMVRTAKIQYEAKEITNEAKQIPETGLIYEYTMNGNETVQTEESINTSGLLDFKGDKPSSGKIILTQNKKVIVTNLISKNKKWCAKKEENEKSVTVGKATELGCSIDSQELTEDKAPCELETETKDSKQVYYIDSVEDMYAFKASVNDGNNYSGKIIKLRNDLDFSSYTPSNKSKVCTDGDNSSGFTPINGFSGTFDGGAKTISNLSISGDSNVGIFGSFSGTIYGLVISNVSASGGGDRIGALIGSNSGIVKEIIAIDVSANGANYIGGVVGQNNNSVSNVIMKSGQVTSRYASVGPIISNGDASSSIIESATILGRWPNTYDDSQKNDLNYYEKVGLDTFVGGDNDTDGYYFDYENDTSNNIVIKSKQKNQIPSNIDTTFSKEGDKYLIKNEKDWKNLSALETQNKKFKLTSNLDFSTKNFYMIRNFAGTLDGGAKTISNVTIKSWGYNNVGVIDNLSGSVYGLNLNNITISGGNNVGSICGYSNGSINEISSENVNITGSNYVAGIVGYSDGSISNCLLKSGSITSTYASYREIESRNYADYLNSLVESATLTWVTQNRTTTTDLDRKGDLNYYSGKIETRIDGDINNTGYYFDTDTNRNGIYIMPAH